MRLLFNGILTNRKYYRNKTAIWIILESKVYFKSAEIRGYFEEGESQIVYLDQELLSTLICSAMIFDCMFCNR